MTRRMFLPLFFLAFLATPALGDTIIETYPSTLGGHSEGCLEAAQTITIPADNVLLNFRFRLLGGGGLPDGGGNVTFSVYQWDAVGPTGLTLYSTVMPRQAGESDYDVLNINLPLVTGELYGMRVDFVGNGILYEGNEYSGGNIWFFGGPVEPLKWFPFPGLDLLFRAEFGPQAAVPEPGTLLLLGSGLLGVAGYGRKKLRRKPSA